MLRLDDGTIIPFYIAMFLQAIPINPREAQTFGDWTQDTIGFETPHYSWRNDKKACA